MSKLNKITLICGALLLISSSTPLDTQASHINNHSNVTLVHHNKKIKKHLTISQLATLDAKKDFKKYNEQDIGIISEKTIISHPYLFKNKEFVIPYFNKLLKLNKNNGNNDAFKEIKIIKYFLPRYLKLTGNKLQGFNYEVKNRTIGNNIPKNKRNNINYAKGFLLGSQYTNSEEYNNSISSKRPVKYFKTLSIDNFYNYKLSKGKVKAQRVLNRRNTNIYNNIIRLANQANQDAWTQSQMNYHFNKFHKHYHMNRSLIKQANEIYDYHDPSQSNSYTPTTKFASHIYSKYPYHKNVYYPNIDDSRLAGNYEGVIIYYHNNRATRKTNNNFRKFIYDYMIYHINKDNGVIPKHKKSLLKYMRIFHKYYIIKNYKGSNNDNCAQWRIIFRKNHKQSSILFIKI